MWGSRPLLVRHPTRSTRLLAFPLGFRQRPERTAGGRYTAIQEEMRAEHRREAKLLVTNLLTYLRENRQQKSVLPYRYPLEWPFGNALFAAAAASLLLALVIDHQVRANWGETGAWGPFLPSGWLARPALMSSLLWQWAVLSSIRCIEASFSKDVTRLRRCTTLMMQPGSVMASCDWFDVASTHQCAW